jgi:hypothetical protein
VRSQPQRSLKAATTARPNGKSSSATSSAAAQRHRLEDIRDNLVARITEAEREGWTGEAEGLRVSLAATNNKIVQAGLAAARRAEAVHLGIPAYRDIAASTVTAPGDRHARSQPDRRSPPCGILDSGHHIPASPNIRDK